MKQPLYEKMESMFHLIQHDYHPATTLEMILYQLARGNAFDMRVVGLEGIKRFRQKHPDCAITFKPNHLSEADFITLGLLFRENALRVLIEGGANLFIDHIDLFQDLFPTVLGPDLKEELGDNHLTIAEYLTNRGSFKVFREPVTVTGEDGEEIVLTRKDILSLTRAYRYHLVREKEMYITFPGYSTVKSGLLDLLKKPEIKTGRSYTGRVDGFHHLPFQMDIEAALFSDTDVYVADVNIAYERVMEDEHFEELLRLRDNGEDSNALYLRDLGYIIKEFCSLRKKVNLSIKFGEPRKIETAPLKEPFLTRKIKNASHQQAELSYENVMVMQPIFSANVYFSAFDENFNPTAERVLRERIDHIRQRLPNLIWGKQKRHVDLYYLLGYNNHIISAEGIINRTFRLFNTPGNPITALDGDRFVVYNKNVARQYRNHVAHFLEED
jgi:hypothetical protein